MVKFTDVDDPLTVVEQPTVVGEMSPAESVQGGGTIIPLHLTPAGIRSILNRKMREKPLLKIYCKACNRSSHDVDTYISEDWLEWCPGQIMCVFCVNIDCLCNIYIYYNTWRAYEQETIILLH